jgi:protein-tyrosine-phosphatase
MIAMDGRNPVNVLFVGGANAARSIMAEAILNREGKGSFQAFSAGIQAGVEVHPYAIDLLSRMSFDVSGLRPKSCLGFVEAAAPPLDFVFSVCEGAADELAAGWPGNPVTAHWDLPDGRRGKRRRGSPGLRRCFPDAQQPHRNPGQPAVPIAGCPLAVPPARLARNPNGRP